ncbi:uncharacterized protein ANIA_10818 [Aspergillus nidulans FGSC A4]|uniref:NAD-dependent epimerase/dehydratase domain-containing protein n=1 Tax=Emericella nidulans (strain FGSC A4 / ATCC 38163 / CBS 112.46 / NRRL 194 / M139) TaxID=227321 RepID=C8V0G3_EMENI|nr:hypothetical protein [Aspergillus nidulans FGSC A4]CBF69499.1 TPA: hypothetical protein ANIA_10818 [Aspergillus nidulans FGSC A4]
MELVAINPVCAYGPAFGKEDSTTLRSITELTSGNAPGIPRIQWGVVDVRDCAELHVLAMTHEEAPAQRFICIGEGMMWMSEMAATVKRNMGDKAKRVTTFQPRISLCELRRFLCRLRGWSCRTWGAIEMFEVTRRETYWSGSGCIRTKRRS